MGDEIEVSFVILAKKDKQMPSVRRMRIVLIGMWSFLKY